MANEIRIYIEGGGDSKDGKAEIRKGFSDFLSSLRESARARRIRWNVVACGSRNSAFEDFKTALNTHSEAFNVLLVDAEGAVNHTPWTHLLNRDKWTNPGITDEHCHLMVQAMEAWIIADMDALESFYGQGFNPNPIPRHHDVEKVPKNNLESSLKTATQNTQKGKYHKIRHGPKLLSLLDVATVREKAQHCNRLFETLTHYMESLD